VDNVVLINPRTSAIQQNLAGALRAMIIALAGDASAGFDALASRVIDRA